MIALGLAAALAALPDRVVVAPPCAADPCAEAPRLTGFAADPSISLDRPEAAIRLAHRDGALVVDVAALAPGHAVELSVYDGPEAGPTALSAHAAGLGAGTALIPMDPPLATGELRAVHLALTRADAPGLRFAWTPVGEPDVRAAFPLLVAPAPSPGRTVEVAVVDGVIVAQAAGAARLSATALRAEDKLGREIERGEPWSAAAEGESLTAPAPSDAAWIAVEARWTDEGGALVDLARARVHHAGATTPALGGAWRPAPLLSEARRGRPFDLRAAEAVCHDDPELAPAAALLAEEAARLHGAALAVRPCADGPAAVQVRRGPGPAEGFEVEVEARAAIVRAPDRRGAVYGALALVDAADALGRVAAAHVLDTPELPRRWLLWRFEARRHRDGFDLDAWRRYVRRVVARGRYNAVVLVLRDGYAYTSHPELHRRGALRPDELRAMREALSELGIESFPGLNSPGHAQWLLNTHPELAEHSSNALVCTRHPDLRPLLADLMGELIEAFDQPRHFHVGGDEVRWGTAQQVEAARCPRCEGVAPHVLYGDHVQWEAEWLLARGVTPLLWGDMLLPRWNGRREGLHEAVDRWPEAVRAGVIALPWTDLGGGPPALRERGLGAMHASTGHYDARRAPLARLAGEVDGSLLALFWPWPWDATAQGWGEGEAYAWPQVVLAGWTAWRPALAEVPITPLLEAMVDTPALRAGQPAPLAGRIRPLPAPPPGPFPASVHPERAVVGGVPFALGAPAVATAAAPLTWPVGRPLRGAAWLQAALLSRDAHLWRLHQTAGEEAPVLAWLEIAYADGELERVPWRYGAHTAAPDGDVALAALSDTSGALRAASPALAAVDPRGRDRTWHRVDWRAPDPSRVVAALRLVPARDGVAIGVIGAVAAE